MLVANSRLFDSREQEITNNNNNGSFIRVFPGGDSSQVRNHDGHLVSLKDNFYVLREEISRVVGGNVSVLSFPDGVHLEPKHMPLLKHGSILFYHVPISDPFEALNVAHFSFSAREKPGIEFNQHLQVLSVSGQAERLGVQIGSKLICIGPAPVKTRQDVLDAWISSSKLILFFLLVKKRSKLETIRTTKIDSNQEIDDLQKDLRVVEQKIKDLEEDMRIFRPQLDEILSSNNSKATHQALERNDKMVLEMQKLEEKKKQIEKLISEKQNLLLKINPAKKINKQYSSGDTVLSIIESNKKVDALTFIDKNKNQLTQKQQQEQQQEQEQGQQGIEGGDEDEDEDDEDDDSKPIINFGEKDGIRFVQSANLRGLINYFCGEEPIEKVTDALKAFLLTYTSFTTVEEFLEALFARFDDETPEDPKRIDLIRPRVINTLKNWIEVCREDFNQNENALPMVNDFIARLDKDPQTKKFIKSIQNSISATPLRRSSAGSTEPVKEKEKKHRARRSSLFGGRPNFAEPMIRYHPVDIAEQLTLISHGIFCSIKAKELLNQNWTKADKLRVAPNITKLTERFNTVSYWAQYIILSENRREDVVTCFIDIASECQKLCNINDCLAIYAALSGTPVFRLKITQELSRDTIKKYNEIQSLFSSDKNYKVYREFIDKIGSDQDARPCVPFIGLYLTDLSFIQENQTFSLANQKVINYSKQIMIHRAISLIQKLQERSYNYRAIDELTTALMSLPVYPDAEKELLDMSYRIKPR